MRYLFTLITVFISSFLFAQTERTLAELEDDLKFHARAMIFDADANTRFSEDSIFTRKLVRALRTPNSFYHPFDSINTVSKLYAPDSSFRIFTWQYQRDENYFRQRGAIQMRTNDSSLKLIPLFDNSEFSEKPTDSLRTPQNWIGAIYYGIVLKEFNNKKYYTLFGYDDHNITSTRKWLDVLSFNEAGQPEFGGRFFDYKYDTIKPQQPAYRFLLEFKKDARARMIYDPEMDMIVFDHLVSESNDNTQTSSLIPDGDYEGFQWKNGKWQHVVKIFDQKIDMSKSDPLLGNAPNEDPLRDKDGNIDEKKLTERSLKTMEKEQAAKEAAEKAKKKPTTTVPPKKKKDLE